MLDGQEIEMQNKKGKKEGKSKKDGQQAKVAEGPGKTETPRATTFAARSAT